MCHSYVSAGRSVLKLPLAMGPCMLKLSSGSETQTALAGRSDLGHQEISLPCASAWEKVARTHLLFLPAPCQHRAHGLHGRGCTRGLRLTSCIYGQCLLKFQGLNTQANLESPHAKLNLKNRVCPSCPNEEAQPASMAFLIEGMAEVPQLGSNPKLAGSLRPQMSL